MELLRFFKKSLPTLIFILVFSIISIIVIKDLLTPKKTLKIYNPVDVNPRLVDASVKHIKRNHKIAPFKLIDQNGDIITNKTYKNKIYVASFFFTRCLSICPKMTTNMVYLQQVFKNDNQVLLLSHSVTPVIDSVPVLRDYANKKGVIDSKWHLVTGDKKEIYNLARKSYFAVLDEGDGGKQDFIHTEQFILVDKEKRIRGFYDGTDKEDMKQLIKDIHLLEKEYK